MPDVLQRLLQMASTNGELCHPVNPTLPCPVLHYANDTLILVRGDRGSILGLKRILNDFSLVTGLTINFHKSTCVPLHISTVDALDMAAILRCSVLSFPQTYLGLPLQASCQRLPTPDHHLRQVPLRLKNSNLEH